jgi:Tfp pilus assembly protein PilO
MNGNSQVWKKWSRWGLVILFVLDLALVVIDRRAGQADAQQQRGEAHRLQQQQGLLAKDVARGEAIRAHVPEIGGEGQRFYQEELLPASVGYSAVVADLGELAGQAGLRTSGVQFEQKAIPNRGVTEIHISTGVEGNYASLIQFINGLERSKNFYLLDNLSLASASSGTIRLNLSLRTYFRS